MDDNFVKEVFVRLQARPDTGDLAYYVTAFSRVGYMLAVAESETEAIEVSRKEIEARKYLEVKRGEEKVTDKAADAEAYIASVATRQAEVTARERANKLRNLLASVEQAINAIKFNGRVAAPGVNLPRGN